MSAQLDGGRELTTFVVGPLNRLGVESSTQNMPQAWA
jgi:hypothetical protein